MRSNVRTGSTRPGSRSPVEDVRRELAPTLRALELAAADPLALEDAAPAMPALQYALHTAGERVAGLDPPLGLEEEHEELAVALAIAREETADVAETLEEAGAFAAAPLLWEWRAALFGVRLALARARAAEEPEGALPGVWRAVLPVALLVLGVGSVLGGALADVWPLWGAGLALVAVSTGLARRTP